MGYIKKLITVMLVGAACIMVAACDTGSRRLTLDSFCSYYGDNLNYEYVEYAGDIGNTYYDAKQYWSNGESAMVVDSCTCFEHNSILREYEVNGYDKYYQWLDEFVARFPNALLTTDNYEDSYESFSLISDQCSIAGYRFDDEAILFVVDSYVPDDDGSCVLQPITQATVEQVRSEMRDLGLEVII